MLGFIVFGVISFQRIGVSQYPDVDQPVVTVTANLEGAAPEIIESDVTDVLEDAVMSVEGIREVSSKSSQGQATVTIEFELSRDIDQAMQDVQARVSQAGRTLPPDMDPPIISKTNPEDQPIMWLALTGTRSPKQLSEYARNVLRDKFLTISGIGDVRMGGYLQRNVRIWIQPDALRQRNLGIDEVITAIERQHIELPAGRIEGPNRVANVRVEGEALDIESVRNLQIADQNGAPVYLKDVALVEDGFEDRTRVARSDGVPAQGLGVIKQRGSNAVAVAKGVKARVAELQKDLPEGMALSVRVDNTQYIENAIHEINIDIVLAVLLTAFVCWAFLGSISSTLNVVLAIPVSIFGTFAVMYFAGFTMNAFSLLALSLSIGIVVDDAIMVLENIYRHAEEGEDKVTAARRGTEQITFAALAATLAIVAIFLPVAFMKGIIGKYFFQFGVVLSVAVLISLLEALTLAPARCAQFLKVGQRGNFVERGVGAAFNFLSRVYSWVLRHALRWRLTILLVSFAIFFVSLKLVGTIKKEFTPPQDQGFFMIRVNSPVGSSVDYTDNVMKRLEAILEQHKEIDGNLTITGTGDMNSGIMFVTLKDRKERETTQQELIAKLRPQMNVFPGTRVILLDLSTSGIGTDRRSQPVQFTVRGPDWEKLAESAEQIMASMRNSGIMVDVDTDYNVGLPEVQVVPDRTKALANGVDVRSVATVVNSMIGGQRVAKYKDNGRRYDVRIRLLQNERMRPEDIGSLFVRNSKGRLVPLSEVTNVNVAASLQSISRMQRERAITVSANLAAGHSQDEGLKAVEKMAKQLPEGYRIVFSGSSQVFRESMDSLFFAMALGLFAAYMVLGSQFNSFIHPITIFAALPFSITGALLAMYFADITLNMYSVIGIILLLGIVKKNSILLVDYTIQMRDKGMGRDEALQHACPVRLRPILMTSFAMIAAAIPGALAQGAGAEIRRPMNIAVIGGLTVATILTLVVVPCFYSVIDQVLEWVKSRGARRKQRIDTAPTHPIPGPASGE